eukprot:1243279-Rhodomonas_salina.2
MSGTDLAYGATSERELSTLVLQVGPSAVVVWYSHRTVLCTVLPPRLYGVVHRGGAAAQEGEGAAGGGTDGEREQAAPRREVRAKSNEKPFSVDFAAARAVQTVPRLSAIVRA